MFIQLHWCKFLLSGFLNISASWSSTSKKEPQRCWEGRTDKPQEPQVDLEVKQKENSRSAQLPWALTYGQYRWSLQELLLPHFHKDCIKENFQSLVIQPDLSRFLIPGPPPSQRDGYKTIFFNHWLNNMFCLKFVLCPLTLSPKTQPQADVSIGEFRSSFFKLHTIIKKVS